MKLNLTRPIVFFDLETTGIDIVKDRIVEISILKIFPEGKEEQFTSLVNPTVPIPQKTTDIHGITNDMVKDKPIFKEIGKQVSKIMEGCDIAGYNSNKFDIPLLAEEFLRADIDFDIKRHHFIDVQVIFHKMEPRTLSAAYKFYCNKELKDAHSASADTLATYEVLKSQIEKYNLDNNIEKLSKISFHHKQADLLGRIIYDKENNEIFNFGKYKGKKVSDVLDKDPSYYSWIMNGDFPLYTKKILTNIKLKSSSNMIIK